MKEGQRYTEVCCGGPHRCGRFLTIYFGIVTKCPDCGTEYRADVCRGCGREPLGQCKIGCPSAAPPATHKSGG